jgi:hypothetical protein
MKKMDRWLNVLWEIGQYTKVMTKSEIRALHEIRVFVFKEKEKEKNKMKRPKLSEGEIDTVISLVDDLYWEWDRLSSSGQETLEKIGKLLDIEPEEEK